MFVCTVLDSLTDRTWHFHSFSICCRLRASSSGEHVLDIGGHEILIFGGEAYDGRELTFYSVPWWSKFYRAGC